jgi:hypothetical protein
MCRQPEFTLVRQGLITHLSYKCSGLCAFGKFRIFCYSLLNFIKIGKEG